MSNVVVKHNADGTITVCIGEECVTVSGTAPPAEPLPKEQVHMELTRRVDELGDIDALSWQQTPDPHIEVARKGENRLTRYRSRGDV